VRVIGERVRDMVGRDRNHPSVIAWSLGPDATEEMVSWLREQADLRLILHRADLGLDLRSDLRVTTSWPTIDDMTREGTADRMRGVLYGNLQHVSGNSLGGFSELWSTLIQYPNLAGGFISLWNDVTDGSARGLVSARRSPRPALEEVRAVFQPLSFGLDDAEEGRYHLKNGYSTGTLAMHRVAWDVQADGAAVLADTLSVGAVPPGERFPFIVLTDGIEPEPGREYVLTLVALEPRGAQVVAREQFVLPIFRSPAPVEVVDGALEVNATPDSVTVRGAAFATTFLRARGEWVSYRTGGRELLVKGPIPNFWRAPTTIDLASGSIDAGEAWRKMSDSPEFTDFEILDEDERVVRLRTRLGLPATGGDARLTYTVYANGDVDVEFAADLGDGESAPPRVGFRMWVPPTLEEIEWFGLGPHETYSDRRASGLLSRHSSSVTEPLSDYGRDQERGSREGVRWMVVRDADGAGWLVVGETMFATSVVAARVSGADGQPTSAAVEWRIDVAHRGVGGSEPRARGPSPAHTIGKQSYEFRVRFRPHDATMDPAARARTTR
ncbi:MAG: beta-galactosidase small subunit-related protein, partial [Planctomycetota bacterium]